MKKEKVSEEESKIDIKEEWKQSEEFEDIFWYWLLITSFVFHILLSDIESLISIDLD